MLPRILRPDRRSMWTCVNLPGDCWQGRQERLRYCCTDRWLSRCPCSHSTFGRDTHESVSIQIPEGTELPRLGRFECGPGVQLLPSRDDTHRDTADDSSLPSRHLANIVCRSPA